MLADRVERWLRRRRIRRESPRGVGLLDAAPEIDVDYATSQASGLVPQAALYGRQHIQPTMSWRSLDVVAPGSVARAAERFLLGEYRASFLGDGGVRVAAVDNDSLVLDPADVSEHSEAWRCVHAALPEPEFNAWRMTQTLANRRDLHCGLTRGQYAGRPAYVIGNGPSALDARLLPERGARFGVTFAINGAAAILPGNVDHWIVCDSLWPRGEYAWLDRLLVEWGGFDLTGARMLAALYTHAWLVEVIRSRGIPVDFYRGCHQNPYRQLVDPALPLPELIESWQSVTTAIHLAWWLGCGPIVLLGVDQSRPVGYRGLHATEGAGWRPSGVPAPAEWYRHPGITGEVETTGYLALCAQHVAALSMWLWDAGCPVWNASRGLDFGFAPPVSLDDMLRDLEPVEAGYTLSSL